MKNKTKIFGRILSMLLALVMALGIISIAACSSDDPDDEATVVSISLNTNAVTTEFKVGDTFTYSGLRVTATYSDGSTASVSVSDCTVSSPDMTTAGTKTVTVTYSGYEASYTITVTESSSIDYNTSHTLTLGGDSVTFADGTTTCELLPYASMPEIINSSSYDIFVWTTEDCMTSWTADTFEMPAYDVTVYPVYDDETYVSTYARTLNSVAVDMPYGSGKLHFGWGTATGGGNVAYSSGVTVDTGSNYQLTQVAVPGRKVGSYLGITSAVEGGTTRIATMYETYLDREYSIEYTFYNLGNQELSFRIYQINSREVLTDWYADISIASGEYQTATINGITGITNTNLLAYFVFAKACTGGKLGITAYITESTGNEGDEPTLSSIELDTSSATTEFTVGDTFSYTGLKVTANYSDDTTSEISLDDCTVSSPDMTTSGTKEVTVSYNGVSATYSITVKESTTANEDGTFTLSISSSYVTFSDGSKTKNLAEGASLSLSDLTVNYGSYELFALATENCEKYWLASELSTFSMPASTLTLYAVFDDETYVSSSTKTVNSTEVDMPYGSGKLHYGSVNLAVGSNEAQLSNMTLHKLSGTALEQVPVYGYKVASKIGFTASEGGTARIATMYDRKTSSSATYSIEYTFYNIGDEDLDFTVYQVNSGKDTSDNFSADIKIAPGEYKTVTINFSWSGSNQNLMSYFVFNAACTYGELAVTAYVTETAVSS